MTFRLVRQVRRVQEEDCCQGTDDQWFHGFHDAGDGGVLFLWQMSQSIGQLVSRPGSDPAVGEGDEGQLS